MPSSRVTSNAFIRGGRSFPTTVTGSARSNASLASRNCRKNPQLVQYSMCTTRRPPSAIRLTATLAPVRMNSAAAVWCLSRQRQCGRCSSAIIAAAAATMVIGGILVGHLCTQSASAPGSTPTLAPLSPSSASQTPQHAESAADLEISQLRARIAQLERAEAQDPGGMMAHGCRGDRGA